MEIDICRYIKQKRLALNMTMESLAKKAGVTRATISSIENGSLNCSFKTVVNIFHILNIELTIKDAGVDNINRLRATRENTLLDKKINRFIVMCVEEYAESVNQDSDDIYQKMDEKGIIADLENDYEDLHGMSTEYLNQYIGALL